MWKSRATKADERIIQSYQLGIPNQSKVHFGVFIDVGWIVSRVIYDLAWGYHPSIIGSSEAAPHSEDQIGLLQKLDYKFRR